MSTGVNGSPQTGLAPARCRTASGEGTAVPTLSPSPQDAAGRESCRRALRHGLGAGPGIQVCRAGPRSAHPGDAARGRRESVVPTEARDPMPEFALVAFGTERNQRSAPVDHHVQRWMIVHLSSAARPHSAHRTTRSEPSPLAAERGTATGFLADSPREQGEVAAALSG
jgi:hypothetical protein